MKKQKGRKIDKLSLFDEVALRQFLVKNDYTEAAAEVLAGRVVDQVFYKCVKGSAVESKPSELLSGFTKKLLRLLDECDWTVLTTTVLHEMTSSNKTTTKLLISLQDGHEVECVILRHMKRRTICISSQVGCKMGCTFCATGALGYEYNLYAGEILQQLVHANHYLQDEATSPTGIHFSNIVFMGVSHTAL